MMTLSAFVPSEQATLVSVFYQIGIWMSHIDDDGDAADAAEEKALMNVLEKTASKYKHNTLISNMAREAHRQQSNHRRWMKDADDAIAQAVAAGKIVKSRLPEEAVAEYKAACMFVAESVAKAFEEGADGQKQGLISKIIGFFCGCEMNAERKISPTEDSALTELSEALAKI